MKIKSILFILSLICATTSIVVANHITSSEITYKRTTGSKIEITLVLYRVCNGAALPATEAINLRCGSVFISDSIHRVSITEIILYCDTASSMCTPQNSISGSVNGLEKHVYKDTFDFNVSPYNGLASCSTKVRVEYSKCCRLYSLSGSSYNHYNYTEFEPSSINESPRFSVEPLYTLCCYQPVHYNPGAQDLDSLTYSYGSVLSNAYTDINPPFIDAYYPGTLTHPYSNPAANPPIGVYLNPSNGDFIFTPTNCTQVTNVVLEVKEWVKDSTGNRIHVGTVRRDMSLIVGSCSTNNPPTIDGPFSYSVCEGEQLCFNITTDDITAQLPPPAATPAPDTVTVSWNNGIPNGSFTVLSDTVLHQTGRFCWTPNSSDFRSNPYSFVVKANDNHCPKMQVTYKAFRVTVKKRATSSRTITPINPDLYQLKSQIDSTFVGIPDYTSSILDGAGQIVLDTLAAKFVSSNLYFSNNQIDTLRLKRNGQFIIESTINNSTNNCPSTYYDTILVDSVLQTLINYPKDTLVCAGTSALLSTSTVFAQGTPSYQWYKNDTMVLTGETSASYTVQNIPRLADVTYTIQVTDDSGRVNRDRIRIRSKDNYDNSFADIYEACLGDSIVLQLDTVFTNRLWYDNATDSVRIYHQSASTWVTYQDSFQCVYNDTMDVIIHALPKPKLRDSSTCGVAMTITAGTFAAYQWSADSSFQSQTYTATTSDTYWVEVTDSNGCKNSDTASIFIWNAEQVDLGNDSTQCGGTIALVNTLVSDQVWSTGDTSAVLVVDSSGDYSIITTDSNGCQSFDTIHITLNSIPTQTWADSLAFCSGNGALLASLPYAHYMWNTGDTVQTIHIPVSDIYSLYFEDNLGCNNTDSVYVKIHELPYFNLGNDTAFCGDSLLLALAPGNAYTWSTGDSLHFTSINASGDYWVQLKDSNGCMARDTVNITLLSNTNVPVLTKNGLVISSNLSGTHRWFMDATLINGQSDSFITLTSIGSYNAVHLDSNDCISDTSNTITKTAGIDKLSSSSLTIYPNPTNGKVTIDATGLGTINSVELYDHLGKQVANTQSVNGSLIDIAWEARSGVLWVVVSTDSGLYRQAVVSVR